MQWEPYVKRYVRGELRWASAVTEQLHTAPLTHSYSFDACVGGEMESYLQKKDKSLKSGVNWIKKNKSRFAFSFLKTWWSVLCVMSTSSYDAALPGVRPLWVTPMPGTHGAPR